MARRYRWIALSNTTLAIFMSALDGSIVIIALPAIFRGIHLDPLAPGTFGYLLWMIMGYLLVQAVFVVTLGRLGDMMGRVRIYNFGFVFFTFASVLLSFDPFTGAHGAIWLIGWRLLQALGGSMLTANSAAILTDAFPANQRGFALGINQISGLAGQFLGLVAGGILAIVDWRAVFWVNVPVGVFGTLWAYRSLREIGHHRSGRIDWLGNITFALGLGALLVAVTFGIHPYGGHAMGWTNPATLLMAAAGISLLIAFVPIERRAAEPMLDLQLLRIRGFSAGIFAALAAAIARGGLQFMLVIWLQGIWLPLHGFPYARTPLWAGICLLPFSCGFMLAGPVSGHLSDRFGARRFSTAGLLVFAASLVGLALLPVDFPYWAFALCTGGAGIGTGMFAAPNTAAIMSSVPALQRGVASGMRSTAQNAGNLLSIGLSFSLMIIVLSYALPPAMIGGLVDKGVPEAIAREVASLPPVSSLFAAFLGLNPLEQLLSPTGVLASLDAAQRAALTGTSFFPNLIATPFHRGLIAVFAAATTLSLLAAAASYLRGPRAKVPQAQKRYDVA
ncbi:MAG TPA: MFS transporter [Candidatus Cybelea sp.]|jgi:MFS family permease